MKKINFAKLVLILTLIFSIISATVFAIDFSVDNTNSVDSSYNDENSSFLLLLSKLGIYNDEYNTDKLLKASEANTILKKLFSLENNVLVNDDALTNEILINALVNSMNIEKSAKLNKIFSYADFGYVDLKYRYSYEAYLNNFEVDWQYLNPKKEVTQKDLFIMLSYHEDTIVKNHGFEIFETKVADVSLYNKIKTIFLSNRNNIIIKEDDMFLLLGDEIETGSIAKVFIKDGKAFALKCKNIQKNYQAGSIYKGRVYLYDRNSNKVILSNVKRYSNSKFNNYITGFCEFDAFNNILFFDNFVSVDNSIINTDYLDKEAVFFTMTDKDNNEKICYIVYGGN